MTCLCQPFTRPSSGVTPTASSLNVKIARKSSRPLRGVVLIIRVLLDEDCGSADLVAALTGSQVEIDNRVAKFDVVRVVDVGLKGASDRVDLARAGDDGRVVVTRNFRDFFKLAREGLNLGGICFTTRPHRADFLVAHSICNAAVVNEGVFTGKFIDLSHFEAYPRTMG